MFPVVLPQKFKSPFWRQDGRAKTRAGRELKFGMSSSLIKSFNTAKFGGCPSHRSGDRS